ncbi:helix-turn-helix domain-containing protein [Paenirhodobacter sp.]|uniref:helix-turn-helix domain-containing protein n=1 Tax=Paenirhodobacter sp. TaxID=1965326 RepID=UPI003B3DD1F3
MRLRIAGSSFADLARALGVTHTSISACSFGRRRSATVQKAIADVLGTTPQELFPERYVTERKTS